MSNPAVITLENSSNSRGKLKRFVIEDNIGDPYPIHIHFGLKKKNVRLHFTYDEFKEFANAIINGGKL